METTANQSTHYFSFRSFKLRREFKRAMSLASTVEDLDDRVNWCDRAFQIVEALDPWPFPTTSRAFTVGTLHTIRGQAYLGLRPRDYPTYSRLALADLEAGSNLFTPSDGTQYAQSKNLLSIAYSERVDGNPSENGELAISACEAALAAIDPTKNRGVWVELAHNLAGHYESRMNGVPHENKRKALSILLRIHAMVLFKFDSLEWATVTASLGQAYHRCNGNYGDDNEKAISLIESALPVLLRKAPLEQWAGTAMNLSACYAASINGDLIANQKKAIQTLEAALETINSEQNPHMWGTFQMNLGALWVELEDGNKTHNVGLAIQAFERALAIFTPEVFPVEHSQILLNLSQARESLSVGPKRANAELALEHARRSLESVSREANPRAWALATICLGGALRERRDGSRQKNIEKAIEAFEAALEVLDQTSEPQLWSMAKTALANALAERITDNTVENLERSILHQQEAMKVLNPLTAPREWAHAMRNLAISFGERVVGSRADNAERALALVELGRVVLNHHDHATLRSEVLETIGEKFEARIRGDRLRNLHHALEAYNDAWDTRNKGENPEAWLRLHHRRLKARILLHNEYTSRPTSAVPEDLQSRLSRWKETITTSDPQEFLAAMQDAAASVTAEDYPRTWSLAQEDLAQAQMGVIGHDAEDVMNFATRFIANLRQSLETYEGMLKANPRESRPLLWARTRSLMASDYQLRHMFEDLLHRGFDGLADRSKVDLPNRSEEAMHSLELASQAFEDVLLVQTAEVNPIEYLKTSVKLGTCHVERRDWNAAASVFGAAAEAADLLMGGVESCESELRDTLRALGDLSTVGPFVELIRGRLAESLNLLEVGRARLLAKTLKLSSLPLSDDEREKVNQLLEKISVQERCLAGPNVIDRVTLLDETIRLQNELREVLAGLDAAVISPKVDAKQLLAEILTDGIVVVIPILTSVGGRILLCYLSAGQVKLETVETDSVIDLEYGIFKMRIKEGLRGWLDAYNSFTAKFDLDQWSDVLAATSERLSELFAEPILSRLSASDISCTRLDILLQGPLGLLPLNLAHDRRTGVPLIDQFEINLSPSLTVLSQVRRRSRQAEPPRTIAFIRHSNGPGEDELQYTPVESDVVTSWFKGASDSVKDGSNTSREEVLEALRGKDIWHFACHGKFNLNVPLQSWLGPFKEENLTLEDLFDARGLGNPRLVVLSACSTGLYDTENLPSEFIGLPNAFLQLGATAVIATLWPISDIMTTLLIGRFYEEFIGNGLPTCTALRAAQRWLRDLRRDELQCLMEKWVSENRIKSENVQIAVETIEDWAELNPTSSALAAYWAGFVHFGA